MRDLLLKLTANTFNDPKVELFNIYHILILLVGFASIIITYFIIRKRSKEFINKFLSVLANVIFILYIFDIFMQPFYCWGSLAVDKLPFHVCTFMALLIPLARFNKHFNFLKNATVTISLIASFLYVFVPGSAFNTYVFSYFSLQTIVYHFIMLAYSSLSLLLGDVKLDIKNIYKEICLIIFILLWASLGNHLYPGYDWFFLEGSTLTPLFSFLNRVLLYILVPFTFIICIGIIYSVDLLVKKRKQNNLLKM